QGVQRVDQGLALHQGGRGHLDIEDIGAQPLGGQFEGNTGAGGGFVEEEHHRAAPKGGHFFDRAGRDFLEGGGGIEDMDDLLSGKLLQGQQVLGSPVHASTSAMTTSSLPS